MKKTLAVFLFSLMSASLFSEPFAFEEGKYILERSIIIQNNFFSSNEDEYPVFLNLENSEETSSRNLPFAIKILGLEEAANNRYEAEILYSKKNIGAEGICVLWPKNDNVVRITGGTIVTGFSLYIYPSDSNCFDFISRNNNVTINDESFTAIIIGKIFKVE